MASTFRHLCKAPEQVFGRRASDQGLFHALHANRPNRDATQSEREARLIFPLEYFQKRRRRGDGEIAVPAGKLDKAIAMPAGQRGNLTVVSSSLSSRRAS
jgi:hypothetical protein